MIRRWLKKLIAEAMRENFPAMHINIEEIDNTNKKIHLQECFFNNSQIKAMAKDKGPEVFVDRCIVQAGQEPFLDVQQEKPKRKKREKK